MTDSGAETRFNPVVISDDEVIEFESVKRPLGGLLIATVLILIALPVLQFTGLPLMLRGIANVSPLTPSTPEHLPYAIFSNYYRILGQFLMLAAWPVVAFGLVTRRRNAPTIVTVYLAGIFIFLLTDYLFFFFAWHDWEALNVNWNNYPTLYIYVAAVLLGIQGPYLAFSRRVQETFTPAPGEAGTIPAPEQGLFRSGVWLGGACMAAITMTMLWRFLCGFVLISDPEHWGSVGRIGEYYYLPVTLEGMADSPWVLLLVWEAVGSIVTMTLLLAGMIRLFELVPGPTRLPFITLGFVVVFTGSEFALARTIYDRSPLEFAGAVVLAVVALPILIRTRKKGLE